MKLDTDLVRKILLWIESDSTIESGNEIDVVLGSASEGNPTKKRTFKFDGQGCNLLYGSEIDGEVQENVLYHYRKLFEAGFVNGGDHPNCVNILDISYAGHEFLNDIKDEEIWRQTKEGAKKIGSFSIETMKEIASAIVKKKVRDLTDGEWEVRYSLFVVTGRSGSVDPMIHNSLSICSYSQQIT
jgi:Hypothetical protein (DUF2513)